MREILFRGKLEDVNSFHYVDWSYGSLVYSPSENQYYIIEHCDEEASFPVDSKTIGQYTGLTDKNGTKIFEGDIVEIIIKNEAYDWDGKYKKYTQKLIGKVIYEKNAFVINSKTRILDFIDKKYVEIQRDSTTYYYTYKVIGNIYDNPELLKEDRC